MKQIDELKKLYKDTALDTLELSTLASHLGVDTGPIIERNYANERKELRAEIVETIPKASKEQLKVALGYLKFVERRLETVGGWFIHTIPPQRS